MDQQYQGLAPPPDDGAPPEELKSKEREQSESEARGGKGDKGDRSRSREGRKKSRRSRSNSRSDERRRRRSRSRSGHRSRSRSRDRRRRERHRRSRSRSRGDRRRRSRSRDRRRRSHSRSPPRSARGPPRAPAAAASSGPQRFFDGFRWIERTVADDPAVLATALNKTRAERRLYVGNLPIGITDMDLKAFFDGALKPILGGVDDAVLSVWLSPSSESQKPYAFVEFATIEGAATALQYLNGKECLGNALRIARPNS